MIYLIANTATTYTQIGGFAVIIIGIVSLIAAYFKTNFAKETIALQASQIDAQSQRIETLEEDAIRAEQKAASEKVAHDTKIAELVARIATLEASIKVLENIKTGSIAIEELNANVNMLAKNRQDAEVITHQMLDKNNAKLDKLMIMLEANKL